MSVKMRKLHGSKYYVEFRELYKNVDLSYVNNGDFINELSKTYASAIVKAENARMVDDYY